MIGPGGWKSGFPVLEKGSCSWVGKGDIEDAWAGRRVKRKAGKNAGGVEEGIAKVTSPVKVGARDHDVLRGEFA